MRELTHMTFKELRQYARDCGYSSITRLPTKQQLIVAINRQRETDTTRRNHGTFNL